MKFSKEKKESIIAYILEKVSQGCKTLSKTVSETLDINQNTVHNYINELVADGILMRVRRGEYSLKNKEAKYLLSRAEGDLNSDIAVYERCLEPHLTDFPKNVQAIWSYVFTEMINNVMDHSAAESVVINVDQNALCTMVSINDNGIGIFRKIKEHFQFDTLDEAIGELFKGKLTTDAENHSGEGIFFSSKMVDDFLIISEEKLFAKNRFERIDVLTSETSTQKGTFVFMSLANDSKKTTQEVFDLYSSVDGGFWKTKLPLKNFFSSSPVSRSQAKRLCNRLEQFEEVELDFEGLEWIGQGFAHQLFIIFCREHPHVKLIPINMSDAVEKMYLHVVNTK